MITDGPSLTMDHEGYVEQLYLDSRNYVTCGYGDCLCPDKPYDSLKEFHKDRFEMHYNEALADYCNFQQQYGLDLDPVRKAAVVDLLFNLGPTKFAKFKDTLRYLQMKDWMAAANALEHSAWFRQVGRRGPRICKLIKEGSWSALG